MLLFRRSRSHNLKNSSKPRVMGSFLSCLAKPPPAGDDPNSAVVTWDEQWTAHKSAGKLLVVNFSGSWAQPCLRIEPAFKEMASRFTDAIFVKIDVNELEEVAQTWKVRAVPTFVLVKDGKEVSRLVGANMMDELERNVRVFITSSSSS